MREWYMNYDLLAVMILIGIITVTLQCVAGWLLGNLYRASSVIGTTENPWLRGMIKRYEAGYQLRVPIHDVPSFVDKNIAEFRFHHLSMEQWADIGVYGAWTECILMGISTLSGLYYKTTLYTFGIYGIYMVLILALIMGCEFFLRTHAHQRGIRIYILDYIENTLRPRLENHYLHPEEEAAYQREYFTKDETAVSGESMKETAMEETEEIRVKTERELSKGEKEKLLSEVLEEYF